MSARPARRTPRLPTSARGIAVFLVAGAVAALLNAVFQRVGARRVAVDDLGAFNALVGIIGGVGLLGLGMQVVLARLPRDGQPAAPSLARLAAVGGALIGVVVAAAVPGPTWYRVDVGLLMAVSATATFCGVAPRARLLQASSWSRVGAVYVVGAAIRLAVLVPLIEAIETQLLATLAATALSEISMSILAWRLAPRRHTAGTGIDRDAARQLLVGFVSLGGLWLLTVADTVLARTRLSDAGADAYAFASTVARSTFFLAQLLAHLALPTFMREHGRTERLRRVFSVATLTIAAVSAAGAGVVVIAPRPIAEIVLGSNADLVDPATLRLLAAAWAVMSVLPLLTYFHSARHPRLAFAPAVTGAAVLAAGTLIDEPRSLAAVTLALVAACVAVMSVPAWQRLAAITRAVEWDERATLRHDLDQGVAVVVPFYNPGPGVLVATVQRLADSLRDGLVPFHIVAVSDGSTDGSAEALAAASVPHVEVVTLDRNRGKGAALRAGFAVAHAPLIAYIDADGDLPPEQIATFLDIAATSGADAVIGSKIHPQSQLATERVRHALSAMFRLAVRLLFRLDVRDTQTGLKVYRGDVVRELVPLLREDGFAIDVEMLVAASRLGGPSSLAIVEAPVRIVSRTSTTVSWRRAASTVAGLGRIFWRDHVALAYRPSPSPAPANAS